MSGKPLQIMPGGRIPLDIGGVREVELIELLGGGGFGYVWKTIDTSTKQLYALKIIQQIKPGSVDEKRVRLEAEVPIDSEYVAAVYGLKEWNEHTFLILFEYFDGTSLDRLLEADALSGVQKKAIFLQILRGVAVAHHHNIIHRDLKPENVLVDAYGKTKLIDFGISKFKGKPITRSGDLLGTISYMAPELNNQGAEVADARCDIYSLGHILYELAMGEHFWKRKGWDTFEDLMQYLDQVPPPTEAIELGDFHCDFFPDARGVLARMIKCQVEDRYKTVNEILLDLGEKPFKPPSPPPVAEPDEPLSNILPLSSAIDLESPLLIVESGDNRLARTVLGLRDGEKRGLGRFDLAGGDDSISRSHLEISRRGTRYFVRDLGSKNGTMVRGILLKYGAAPVEIHHDCHIKVGDIFLRFAFLAKTEKP
jgi:eukaryotic-like serine/threonine-protein kinase